MATKETQEPLKGFVKPSQGSIGENEDLPTKPVNGFDPNTYKLLAKAGFGQQSTSLLKRQEKSQKDKSLSNEI